ncbi:MAG: hypothetical protein OEN55_03035 [Alphaproteobacteria bacterium]|nr:hypothetical protein [Alphaproteobacteria bacterium]
MRLLYCFIAMGLALMAAGPAAFAQEALPDAFEGRFRGTLSGTSGETSGEFTVTIRKSDGGFMVNWPPRIVAQFEPAGHPGVFKTREKSKVLEGNPVYWARIEDGTLIVYSAQVGEHGGYHVDNFIYTPSGEGLDLFVRHVVTGAEPQISSGKLNRYGG